MANTKSTGEALRGGDSGTGREVPGSPEILTCQETGRQYIIRNGWKTFLPPTMRLRYPVDGLTARKGDTYIRWTWTRNEATDEADARDAQCRAGWHDTGYGFWGFQATSTGATWLSEVNCE